MLSIILQHEGHQAAAVTSADAALEHLRHSHVDVVLSELFLGSLVNGLHLCAIIHREWPRVRFFLGTRTQDFAPAIARACHAEAVLIKPYHLADVRRLVAPPVPYAATSMKHSAGPPTPSRPYLIKL